MVFALTGKLFLEFVLAGLNLSVGIDRSRNQRVAARRDVAPIVGPKEPGKPIASVIDSGGSPSPIVNPDFDEKQRYDAVMRSIVELRFRDMTRGR